MDQDQRLYAIGCYINSALYLTGVFVAAMVLHIDRSWKTALVTAGICFLSYAAQILKMPEVGSSLALVSVIFGIGAGVLLLIG